MRTYTQSLVFSCYQRNDCGHVCSSPPCINMAEGIYMAGFALHPLSVLIILKTKVTWIAALLIHIVMTLHYRAVCNIWQCALKQKLIHTPLRGDILIYCLHVENTYLFQQYLSVFRKCNIRWFSWDFFSFFFISGRLDAIWHIAIINIE